MIERAEECECCGFATTDLALYQNAETKIGGSGKIVKKDFWFCDLCAATPASVRYRYCQASDEIKAICYIGNVILSRLVPRHTP